MSPYFNSAIQVAECSVYAVRWAIDGQSLWHVFVVGLAAHNWFPGAAKCVIDDFGNLVAVSS